MALTWTSRRAHASEGVAGEEIEAVLGELPGSGGAIALNHVGQRLVFSGDIGCRDDLLMPPKKKIADEHGARIELSNRVADGTTTGAQVSLSFALAVEPPGASAHTDEARPSIG